MAISDPNEVVVVAFPDESRANDVLRALQELNKEHTIHLRNAAVLVRHRHGDIAIHETHDFDAKQGAVAGALAGGLIGMLSSGKLLQGAVIGATGGMVASRVVDLGFKDDYLKSVAETLTPGSSAIVAVIAFEHVEDAMRELHQFEGGKILRTTLAPDISQQLANALQG